MQHPVRSSVFRASVCLGLASLAACGSDGPSTPSVVREKPFTVIAGGNLTDTVQGRPAAALVVQVRDSLGVAHKGMVVRFEALPPLDSTRRTETAISVAGLSSATYGSLSIDQADTLGRAKALIAFGSVAGTVRLRVVVPELGRSDTLGFSVQPGAPAKMVIGTRDTTIQPGASYALRARIADRFGNAATGTVTYAAGIGVATVTNDGVVTAGSQIARGWVAVKSSFGTDTARLSIAPRVQLIGTRYSYYAGTTQNAVTRTYSDGAGAVNLATAPDQSMSPSQVDASNLVVFYSGDPGINASLVIIDPKTGVRPLTSPATGFNRAAWPRLSPDAQWVYFIGARSAQSQISLWRIRVDGTQADSLTTVAGNVYAAPGVSPNGQLVAVSENGRLRIFNLTTRTAQSFTQLCNFPRFSPDGTKISCVISGGISILNADGTPNKFFGFSGLYPDINAADWTPDGSALLVNTTTTWNLLGIETGTSLSLPNLTGYIQLLVVR